MKPTQWEEEVIRLGSLVGTDAKEPEKKLLDFIREQITLAENRGLERAKNEILDKLKYDLFPAQVRQENPTYWKGYTDTVKKIAESTRKLKVNP